MSRSSWLTWCQATRAGYFAESGPLSAEFLGREPRTVADRFAEAA
ncbi:hypothetical protein [Amycolatopsis rubida]|uniref:Uncharacterized protein n=1 Tax=Amycolatopsis rubida TaxID=112413 RepID=A0A1I5EKN3_9PSEU|nr:hypothetical protein [Amycolatopsis rubida]SFO12028.1 hypothetical protein SAMN05421854_101686 [Amycolatopsis rubida]